MTTTDSTRAAAPLAIEDLRPTFLGRVIGPDDPDYDRARAVMYGGVDDAGRRSSSRSPTPTTSSA